MYLGQNLGELVLPSNYDAQLVTTQRMLPDGSIGVFVGDYQLTPLDLQRLEKWRQDGIAYRQHLTDVQLATQAVALAAESPTPSIFSAGPGYVSSQAPNYDLAYNYLSSIQDPLIKADATKQAVTASQGGSSVYVKTPAVVVNTPPNYVTGPGSPGGVVVGQDPNLTIPPNEDPLAPPVQQGRGNDLPLIVAAIAALTMFN